MKNRKPWLSRAKESLLESSIVLSFGKHGFDRHAASFNPEDLDLSLRNKTIVVTGANSGIGKETTRALARLGAHVIMVCRNPERGEQAQQELLADGAISNNHGRLSLVLGDLSDLDSVDKIAEELAGPIDVLIHNAGALVDERIMSKQGVELTVATHLTGPLRLSAKCMPKFATGARIIWVSSGGMYLRKLSVKNLARTLGSFDGAKAYADAKRAQVVMSEMLAERLAGRAVSNAMHPGWASTPGVKTSIPRFYRATQTILRSPAEGADTVVWLAACERIAKENGLFWFDREKVPTHKLRRTRESSVEREKLWHAAHEWAHLSAECWVTQL